MPSQLPRRILSCRLTRLFFSSSSAAAAAAAAATSSSSNELLPWLPPPKRKPPATGAATNSAAPAVITNSPTRQAMSKGDATDDPKHLFALFSHAAKQPGFRHDHPSYKDLISKMTRLEGLSAIHRILFHMRNEKIPCRPAILVAIIDVCAASGFPIKPLSLLMSAGPAVREKVFARLVDALVETRRLGTAGSLFTNDDVISKLGFPLRVRHYIGVVRGYCDQGEIPAAVELLDEMSQRGLVPDVFSYGSLVAGISRRVGGGHGHAVDDALAVVEQMRRAGGEPDVVVYNALVHGCVREGAVERAEGMVREMEEGGEVGCDAGTYNALMGGAVDVVEVLRRMMGRGVAPDVITFTVLLGRLRREGRAAEAGAPLGVMVKMGMRTRWAWLRALGDGGAGVLFFFLITRKSRPVWLCGLKDWCSRTPRSELGSSYFPYTRIALTPLDQKNPGFTHLEDCM